MLGEARKVTGKAVRQEVLSESWGACPAPQPGPVAWSQSGGGPDPPPGMVSPAAQSLQEVSACSNAVTGMPNVIGNLLAQPEPHMGTCLPHQTEPHYEGDEMIFHNHNEGGVGL